METQPDSRNVKGQSNLRTMLLTHHPDGADAEMRVERCATSESNPNPKKQ